MVEDFEISRVASTIRQRGCKTVILQFPEGLKRRALVVASDISSQVPECDIAVSGEPCFGACDIPYTGADLVVNFGHLPIPSLDTKKSVLYIQARSDADPVPVLEDNLDRIPDKVGLITTAQHIHVLSRAVEFLTGRGKRAFVGKGDGRIFAEGQVLGCNVSSAKAIESEVDGFVYIGTGMFHPLAVSLSTSKTVLIANPVTGEFGDGKDLKDRTLRLRHALIQMAGEADAFGILVSMKAGQRREALAREICGNLKRAGKKLLVVEMDTVTPQKLDAFGLDCWVSTACPRLAIDDAAMFSRPVLTPVELEIVLRMRKWDDYAFDII